MKTFLLLLLLSLSVVAQTPQMDYGSISELKGVKRIFIYTGADVELRDKLRDKIQKKLPQLTVTDSESGAEAIVIYSADSATYLASINAHGSATTIGNRTNSSSSARPVYRKIEYGDAVVVRYGERGRLRLLMNWSGDKSHFWQKGLSAKFADAFIKAYMKANAE